MCGLCELHDDKGDCGRKRRGYPSRARMDVRTKDLGDDDAYHGAEEMAAEQGTRLGEWNGDRAITKDGRCALGKSVLNLLIGIE